MLLISIFILLHSCNPAEKGGDNTQCTPKDLGYEFVVIDMGWYGDAASMNYTDFVRERLPEKPNYSIYEFGRIIQDLQVVYRKSLI